MEVINLCVPTEYLLNMTAFKNIIHNLLTTLRSIESDDYELQTAFYYFRVKDGKRSILCTRTVNNTVLYKFKLNIINVECHTLKLDLSDKVILTLKYQTL